MAKAMDTAAARLSWKAALAWRLRRHYLDVRRPGEAMLRIVSEICGLHAQLMSSAELTLWARTEDLQPDAVQRALWGLLPDSRSLVSVAAPFDVAALPSRAE